MSGIGPIGKTARVIVGAGFIAAALLWRDPTWFDPLVGFVVLPAVAVAALALRARFAPAPLAATGPLGHLLVFVIFVPLLFLPATAGGALLFLGSAMLIAAARRSPGCELTVIPNAVLGRQDQIGCALFLPVDLIEHFRGGGPSAPERERDPALTA